MIDRSSRDRFLGRDTGEMRSPVGLDRGVNRRPTFTCSATCSCGARLDAGSPSELRDRCACHAPFCNG